MWRRSPCSSPGSSSSTTTTPKREIPSSRPLKSSCSIRSRSTSSTSRRKIGLRSVLLEVRDIGFWRVEPVFLVELKLAGHVVVSEQLRVTAPIDRGLKLLTRLLGPKGEFELVENELRFETVAWLVFECAGNESDERDLLRHRGAE